MTTNQPQNPNPYESAPWATGRHASTPPPVPPHGMGAWAPVPPEPPRKKRGVWKWVVGVLAVLVVIGMVNGGESPDSATAAAPVAEDAPAPEPVTAPAAPAVPAAPEPAEDATQRNLDELGRKLDQRAAEAGRDAESGYNGYGATTAAYGESVTAGDMVVSVDAPETHSQQYLGNQSCAHVSYRNTGTTSEPFNMFDWKFRTSNGVETSISAPFTAGDKALTSGELAPGGNVSGLVCGDLGTTNVTAVVYNPGFGVMHEVAFSG